MHCGGGAGWMLLAAGLLLGLLGAGPARAELYTALVALEELLETEAVLMNELEGFIAAEEEKLRSIRRHYSEYAKEHDEASKDIQAYLSNPINAYLLVKRLTTDWKSVESQMVKDVGKAFIQNMTKYRKVLKFPSEEDLNGAAVALMRLQDTYKLDTASLANGELNGIQYSTELSSNDCFELGRQSYFNSDYYHTVLWMQEALQRYDDEHNKTTTKADILDYLAYSTYMQGNVHTALKLTDELLELNPSHKRAIDNRNYYLKDLESRDEHKKGEDGHGSAPADDAKVVMEKTKPKETYGVNEKDLYERAMKSEKELYEMLCRNEVSVPVAIQSQLKCRYTDLGSPFLKLARVKEEEAYLKPRIVIYHDIIYDSEIEVIKKLSLPRFQRATVQNSQTGELEAASYRISKSAWLKNTDHKYVDAVSKRVEDLTGLNMKSAEDLQVVNYGIGGHYEPHYDFARKEELNAFKALGSGNRIATVLFYMSDVAQGGATVFPSIKVSLWPKKGSAAMWYNLHKNGEGDMETRHAACPVLAGSKWVSNKWIHEYYQEFRRPCGLTND